MKQRSESFLERKEWRQKRLGLIQAFGSVRLLGPKSKTRVVVRAREPQRWNGECVHQEKVGVGTMCGERRKEYWRQAWGFQTSQKQHRQK
jgi:hypothetical protein